MIKGKHVRYHPEQDTAASAAADCDAAQVSFLGKKHVCGRAGDMKSYRVPHTDLFVSRIAYGCAGLTSWDKSSVSLEDIAKATRLIQVAYENGITLFDHADLYAFGKAECVFGEVLKRSPGLRDKIVIQSKCGQCFPDEWSPGDPIKVDLSGTHIVNSVEGSLRRLNTDRLDILLLHVPDPLLDPQEVAQAFDALRRDGKVRYFGVSNYDAIQIELLQKELRQPIVVNQIHLGIGHYDGVADGMGLTLQIVKGKDVGHRVPRVAVGQSVDYCRVNNILVQAWSPLRGILNTPISGLGGGRVSQLLEDLAGKKDAAPSAIALAWLLRHPANILPIIGSAEPQHIIDNCRADKVSLSRDEWYKLFAAAADLKSDVTQNV